MSVVTGSWLRFLENRPVAGGRPGTLAGQTTQPIAIVVLGAGSYFNAPEYGRDTVSRATLERLRWAARLHRETRIPILVSGGSPSGGNTSEAEQMRDVLVEDFAVPVQWLETRARNTYESAYETRTMLGAKGAHILLVTHAAHMPRAVMVFGRAGFEITPSATSFTTPAPTSIHDFVPSVAGLRMGRIFLHEILGTGWYYIRLASGDQAEPEPYDQNSNIHLQDTRNDESQGQMD